MKSKPKKPIEYTPEIGMMICEMIATSSKSISALCATNPDFPNKSTIWEWRIKHSEFERMYIISKQRQIEVIVDEMLDISDDSSLDTIEKEAKDGSTYRVCNYEWIARSKLRLDTRRWLASKLCPKIYGDRVYNENNITIRHEDALKELE